MCLTLHADADFLTNFPLSENDTTACLNVIGESLLIKCDLISPKENNGLMLANNINQCSPNGCEQLVGNSTLNFFGTELSSTCN